MAPGAGNRQPEHQAAASATAFQLSSHGRGGAGNMADVRQSPKLTKSDLETPVLRNPVVTTGRGGTGNMAKNDDPLETRLRQDVAGVPRRCSSGAQHAGRGGAGNVLRETEPDANIDRTTSRDAVDDVTNETTSPSTEPSARKGKIWPFGKRN